jgi:hypothetical protein
MKTVFNFLFLIVALSVLPLCRAQQVTQPGVNLPAPTPPIIISRDANSRVWERTDYEREANGQIIPVKHQYTELASGLCYQQDGQWLDSLEQINILPDGSAAATNGQHQVYFPADIYKGVITMVTPEGLLLQSQPIGLSYDDGTNIVLIGELTNSVGQLISSNQVIYPNAFAGVEADLLYTYRKSGFEQDVVFRSQPPSPEEFGLNPANTRLQMLTEFFNAPTPVESSGLADPQYGLHDTTLAFGSTKMTHGRAFLTGTKSTHRALHSVSVDKTWATVDGRTLLIEGLSYQKINSDLKKLPPPSAASVTAASSILRKVSSKRPLAGWFKLRPTRCRWPRLTQFKSPG